MNVFDVKFSPNDCFVSIKTGEGLLLSLWSPVAFSGPAIKPNEAAVDKQIARVTRGVLASLGDIFITNG